MVNQLKNGVLVMIALMFALTTASLAQDNMSNADVLELNRALDDLQSRTGLLNAEVKDLKVKMGVAAAELCAYGIKEELDSCAAAAIFIAEDDLLPTATKETIVVKALKIGCAGGNGASCVSYSHPDIRTFFSDDLVKRETEKGIKTLGTECQAGQAVSCRQMSDGLYWFTTAYGTNAQLSKAMPASLKRSCDLGDVNGCASFATALADGTHGFPKNPHAAKRLRTQLCEHGLETACTANEIAEWQAK